MAFCKGRGEAGRCIGIGPYETVCRGGVLPRPRATARVAPTEGYKRCGGVKNPPVTASPCQPPLGKGAKGTGERIATASDRSRRNSRVIPRPVRRLVVGIRNTPAQIQRGTDCHSQCAHWLRNDTLQVVQ